jgi:hypothetical protein
VLPRGYSVDPSLACRRRSKSKRFAIAPRRWHFEETAPQGRPNEAASSKARAVLCSESNLQHSTRHEIKDFQRALLSYWTTTQGAHGGGLA